MMKHVRRPLALLAAVFLAAVFLVMLFSDGLYEMAVPGEEVCLLTGVLRRKEIKKNASGEATLVYYVERDAAKGELVMCELSSAPAYEPMCGARVTIRGSVGVIASPTNPGEFDSRRYYAVMKIAYRLRDAVLVSCETTGSYYREGLYRLRVKAGEWFDALLSPGEAGVLRAVILGDKSGMEKEVKTLYAAGGILHILAVSGLHVSFLGGMLYAGLLRIIPVRCGRLRLAAAGLSVFVMISYGLFTGLSASAFRAVVMFVMKVIADRLGRTYDIVTALAVAAVLLILEQPLYLFYSGFQFSFLAVLGVSVLQPALAGKTDPLDEILMRESRGRRALETVRQAFLVSLSVTLMTLPVQLYHQFTAPVYAAVLNLLVIPLMSVLFPAGLVLLLCCGCAEMAGVVFSGAGVVTEAASGAGSAGAFEVVFGAGGLVTGIAKAAGAVCEGVLHLYEVLCMAALKLPFATWYAGRVHIWQIVLYYLLLAGVIWYAERARAGDYAVCGRGSANVIPYKDKRYKKVLGTVILLAAGIAILGLRLPPRLKITMLDVGQGDGIVIRHRDGLRSYRILIDGGSSSKSFVGTYQIEPYLKHEGIGVLDAVFVSHEDTDHFSGVLEIMEHAAAGGIQVKALFLPDAGRDVESLLVTDAGRDVESLLVSGAEDQYAQIVRVANSCGVPVYVMHAGEKVTFGAMSFTCLGPLRDGAAVRSLDANAHSMILRLDYDAFSALFTGDVEKEGLPELLQTLEAMEAAAKVDAAAGARGGAAGMQGGAARAADINLLKVAHHGSRGATNAEILALTRPEVALVSCGRDNRYGHPHAEVMELLEDAGARTFVTAKSGAITVCVARGGRKMTVEEFVR